MRIGISRFRRALLLTALLPLLAACENSATAYMVEGKEHALILVREQKVFWVDEIKQAVIASRLPNCQKRVTIHPGVGSLQDMQVYEAGDRLWALHQGNRWYLASTEVCRVQDWDNAAGKPPGRLVGSFTLKEGVPAFVSAPADGG